MPRDLILALETSSPFGSVALWGPDRAWAEIRLAEGLRHGQLLLPAVAECLARSGRSMAELAAVAVGVGPGSYTGTRIGVMAAKALTFAAGVRLLGVSSLTAQALDAAAAPGTVVVPVQDARRDEVYAGAYRLGPAGAGAAGLAVLQPEAALAPEEALALARNVDGALFGSALERYPELFAPDRLPAGVARLTGPDGAGASAIARLARLRLAADEGDDPLALQPLYLRRADAPPAFKRIHD